MSISFNLKFVVCVGGNIHSDNTTLLYDKLHETVTHISRPYKLRIKKKRTIGVLIVDF